MVNFRKNALIVAVIRDATNKVYFSIDIFLVTNIFNTKIISKNGTIPKIKPKVKYNLDYNKIKKDF